MRHKIILFPLTFISLLIFYLPINAQEAAIIQGSEHLTYRIHLGFINAATATIKSSSNTARTQQSITRRIEILGKTNGILDLISPVIDFWSADLDIYTGIPLQTEMKKSEGRYKKEEIVQYDHENGLALIHSNQNKPADQKISIQKNMLDIISGYYFLRDKNLSVVKIGDKLRAKVLMDGTIYEIRLYVKGFENIESEFGPKKCIRTSLVLPKNNLFKDEDAIRLWISQDQYQIPLKIEVNLKIGFLTIDLMEYLIKGKKVFLSAIQR